MSHPITPSDRTIPLRAWFSFVLLAWIGVTSGSDALAVQGAGGITYFEQVPTLDHASVAPRHTRMRGATLQVTVTVPAAAGEPLHQIQIDQTRNPESLRISAERIATIQADRWQNAATQVPTQVILPSETDQPIQLVFDPPITPGSTITIGFHPIKTPRTPGPYLFGITAFPIGDQPHAYFLGYAEVTFNDRGGNGHDWRF